MKKITSKDIKKYILNHNDLDILFEYIDDYYKETLEGILNALFILMKHPERNKEDIEYLIFILKEQLKRESTSELKKLIGPIVDLQNKINDKFNLKERIKIKNHTLDLQNIFNEINIRMETIEQNKKIKCLEFLIFQDKNLQMISQFIKENETLLNKKIKSEESIFLKILKKYISSTNEEEQEYLYQVIMIFLKSKISENILKNKKAYLKILEKPKQEYPKHVIRLIKLLDSDFKINTTDLENRYQIHFTFPQIILNETNYFNNRIIYRRDFTNQEVITIDGKETLCQDDGLYIEKNNDNTYTLYIHITDIPSLIPFSSKTREEAYRRQEAIYLKDINLPLYPTNISNNLCSLIPNNKRNTITYIFKLDEQFRLIPDSLKIEPGIIKSTYRLTYDQADIIINNPNNYSLDTNLILLSNFAKVSRRLNTQKESYRNYENILFKENHHVSTKIDYSPSSNIIHESIVLANYSLSKYFKSNNLPYIYRKLDIPSPEFIEKQLRILRELNSNIELNKEFINNLKDSYIKAIYCTEPTYHKGLNVECYSHSTCPGRRYIDSLGQYIIYDLIFEKNIQDKNIYKWETNIKNTVEYANKKKKQNEKFKEEYNYLYSKRLIKEK